MDVDGSVALVTGANRGFGRALAEELLDRGAAKVYAAVRDTARVSDPRVTPIRFDLRDRERIREVAEELSDLTLVVNNAATVTAGSALTASLAAAEEEIAANYLGLVASTQAFAPVLAANGGGAFINVLALVAWQAHPQLATHSASKSAVWGFTDAARVTLAEQNTRLLAVEVGLMDTDARHDSAPSS